MRIPDGLNHADFRTYRRQAVTSHTAQYHIRLTDLNGNLRSSITTDVVNGQVLGDLHHFGRKYGPTRRLLLSVLDPDNTLDVSPRTSAAAQSFFLTTLIHVDHVVRVDDLGEHIHCPLFSGRPSFNLTRSDDVVKVTADDKAVLGMGQAWRPLHIPKHTPKVEAIRRILAERMGEVRFDFPTDMDRPVLHRSINIGRMGRPWAYAERIADSMDMQLFYRGDVATLRHWPRRPSYTFDPAREIVAAVETDIRMHGFKDLVEIRGHRQHGSRRRIRAVARPNRGEDWSPDQLAYHDVPGFHVLRETHPHIRSKQEAERRAGRILEDRMDAVAGEASMNIVPLAFLEEGDKYRGLTTSGDLATFRLRSFAFPVGVAGDGGDPPAMNLNYHEKPPLHPPHHKLRRRHRGA